MFRSRDYEQLNARAGFTLIEVLVALAVIAIALPVIGALLATNIRGTIKVEQRTALLAAYRTLEANLLERTSLSPGTRSGEIEGTTWFVEIRAFHDDEIGASGTGVWAPREVVTTLRSPSGETLRVETVRLGRQGDR